MLENFLRTFAECGEEPALLWNGQTTSYSELSRLIAEAESELDQNNVQPGEVVLLLGDFSPRSVSLLFALIRRACIIVPQMRSIPDERKDAYVGIVGGQHEVAVDDSDTGATFRELPGPGKHEFYDSIRAAGDPGLILFTSGSSGKPKAAVHNFSRLLAKFETRRKSYSMINFLLWDHWGGLNTLLHILSCGGTVLSVPDRSTSTVCKIIEEYRVEVLPASPSFLNLLLVNREYQKRDLSSLKLITYGTEPMPETTLKRLHEVFPEVRLQQTYGLIELGVLRAKSKSSDSLWVKVGGEGYQTRVVDGLLQIRAESAMLGYLNAPSPFTEDGWFMTGDAVEVDGEYLRILGRRSELINVGGEKVYPQEVENCIQELDCVADVTVFKKKNPLLGFMVCARVRLAMELEAGDARKRIRAHCRARLEKFKVPVKIEFVEAEQHNERFKKARPTGEES